jgi:flagellar FliL protein
MTAPTAARENRWGTNGRRDASVTSKGDVVPAKEGGDAAAPVPPKRARLKSKKALIAIAAVLALGAGGYTFLMPSKAGPPSGGDVVSMDATTLNLTGGHYLKIAVAVQLVKGKATATGFYTSHAAELTIDEFSNRTVESLSSNDARKKLTADLLVKIQKAYPGEVFNVFLTQFVTQ